MSKLMAYLFNQSTIGSFKSPFTKPPLGSCAEAALKSIQNQYPPWNYHSTRENTVVLCKTSFWLVKFWSCKSYLFFYVFSGIFSLPKISPTFSASSPASLATRGWRIKRTTGSSTTSVVAPVQLRRTGGRSPEKIMQWCLIAFLAIGSSMDS